MPTRHSYYRGFCSFLQGPCYEEISSWPSWFCIKIGLVRDLNPGPLAPKARIIPLDQRANWWCQLGDEEKIFCYPNNCILMLQTFEFLQDVRQNVIRQHHSWHVHQRPPSCHHCNRCVCARARVGTSLHSQPTWPSKKCIHSRETESNRRPKDHYSLIPLQSSALPTELSRVGRHNCMADFNAAWRPVLDDDLPQAI